MDRNEFEKAAARRVRDGFGGRPIRVQVRQATPRRVPWFVARVETSDGEFTWESRGESRELVMNRVLAMIPREPELYCERCDA